MTSGLRWSEDTTENQIQQTPDWIATILGLSIMEDEVIPAAGRDG